jgi:hypothetical protein
MRLKAFYGTNRFPWRCRFLLGYYWGTDWQLKQIWRFVVSSILRLSLVWPVAETSSQVSIYLSFVVSLALFGRQLGLGLVCHRWMHKIWLIILFSLLFHLVDSVRVALSFSFFGSYVFGLFGTKETNDYSEIQSSHYLSCWARSNFIFLLVVENNKY